MKRCPTCSRAYADDTLRFCRHDGAPLAADEGDPTRLFDSSQLGGRQTGSLPPDGAPGRAATSSSLTTPIARRRGSRKTIDSLAVLPLTNESDDREADYLCDGITESIINSLSQLPRLRVVPRSTAFRHRGAEVDPQAVGRLLGVRAVLAGRVLQVGEWLIVKAELIDVEQESQLWGEQYRREWADILALEAEISRDISAELRLKLTGEERRKLARRYTENAEAYDAYLKGRHYVTSKRTEDWIKKGIEGFQRAIDLDPNYALAYAGLAEAYAFLASSTGGRPPRETFPKAKAAAQRALAIDPALAEAHSSLGFSLLLYDWDFPAALREFKRAVKLNPNYANAHDGLAFYYNATGRHEEALAECEKSRRLEPLSPFPEVSIGWAHYFARRYERAAEQGRKALEMEPRLGYAGWIIGVACTLSGCHDEAVAALERAVEVSDGGLIFKAHLAYAQALAGEDEAARRILAELTDLARTRYVSAYYFAITHLGLGETAQCLDALESALEERSGFPAFLKVEPMFDPVRSEPRFARLVKRVGLEP